MPDNGGREWLRGRGIGRERLAGHFDDFLASNGFKVERLEDPEGPATTLRGELSRMNPAVPESGRHFEARLVPTSGGCAVYWVRPIEVAEADRPRLGRFVREMLQHVERSVSTGSHGTAKVARALGERMPWEAT